MEAYSGWTATHLGGPFLVTTHSNTLDIRQAARPPVQRGNKMCLTERYRGGFTIVGHSTQTMNLLLDTTDLMKRLGNSWTSTIPISLRYLLKGMSLYQEDDYQQLTTDPTIYTPSSDGRLLGISPYQTGITSTPSQAAAMLTFSTGTRGQFCTNAESQGKNSVLKRLLSCFPLLARAGFVHTYDATAALAFGQCFICQDFGVLSVPTSYDDTHTPNDGNAHSSEQYSLTKVKDTAIKKWPSTVAEGEKPDVCRGKTKQAPKVRRLKAQDKAVIPATPTRILPDRPGRNIHPAGVPKIWCSKVQTKADREAEMKALDKKLHEICMSKEWLTQMDVMEECEEDKEDDFLQHPPRLSAMIQKRHLVDMETDSEECFDLREAGNSSELDSEPESHKAAETETQAADTETKRSRKKRIKGAARQELKMRTEELRNTKRSVKSQIPQLSKCVVKGSSLQELCQFWPLKQSLTPPDVLLSQITDQFVLGGLCDDDLEDARPAMVEQSPRDITSCRNEMVTIGEKTDVRMGKPLAKSRVPKPKAAKTTAKKKVLCVEEVPVDMKPSTVHCDIAQECLDNPHWTHTFLPTLSHALYISNHPFMDWTWESSTFLETTQAVFDMSFTNISYTISPQDCILKVAYDRMKTRRSKIVGDVLALVKRFFEGPEFHTRPKKIKDYVPWALGAGGPAYYDTPVPADCRLQLGDPDCPQPDGFLHSQFILPIAKQYLTFVAKSVYHPTLGPKNLPKGLYAIILTAQALNFSGSDDIAERCADELLLSAF
ncbi:hypothetical protein EI94DRAFT_1852452 [Lactarius quietus]|nr:hypothetical protein EI94DRAFT_1852452 [Lactarius quietus]